MYLIKRNTVVFNEKFQFTIELQRGGGWSFEKVRLQYNLQVNDKKYRPFLLNYLFNDELTKL